MTQASLETFVLSLTFLGLSVGVTACDSDQVGVHEVVMRTGPDGVVEPAGGGCILLQDADGGQGGGGGGGPDFAQEMLADGNEIHYRYFIAPEDAMDLEIVTPANGELAAELDADMEFFRSGETKNISFQTYDGITLEVFLWGEEDCEGDPPLAPPPEAGN
jgi:hypothetical protein